MSQDQTTQNYIENLKDAVYEIKHDVMLLKAKAPFWIKTDNSDKVLQSIDEIYSQLEKIEL